jgi:hypothetical protein
MARVPNELFHYLTSRGIFKNYFQTNRASEATEKRRFERNRGVMVWLSTGRRTNTMTGISVKIGKGTYIRKLHGRLKHDRNVMKG